MKLDLREDDPATSVTAMSINCRNFAIRVSGLGDKWILAPHATVQAKLLEDHNEDEITWGEARASSRRQSGLGGFAQAAAFPRPASTRFLNSVSSLPRRSSRDRLFEVRDTGIRPVMDIG